MTLNSAVTPGASESSANRHAVSSAAVPLVFDAVGQSFAVPGGTHEVLREVTFTADGSTRTSPVPGALTPSLPSTCYFDPKQVSISADGSALYMDAFVGADKNKYVIDTVNGEAYMSPALNVSEQLTWVYDDMLIAVSKAGVKAFVPASS